MTNTNDEAGLRAAHDQFFTALNAMFTGDLVPMNAIWSHQGDVTNLGPFGGRLEGWEAVGAQFRKEAAMQWGDAGRVVYRDLIVMAGKDLGYTICVEQGENMSVDGRPVVVNHRATKVFRIEDGGWRLVHHHTDLAPQLQTAGEVVR
jgi:ketosteroid isomerase-like protein